jgi:hypothetical protein
MIPVYVLAAIVFIISRNDFVQCIARTTQIITLPSSSIGTKQSILVHRYIPEGSKGKKTAYVQASLHAEELPGLIIQADLTFSHSSTRSIVSSP